LHRTAKLGKLCCKEESIKVKEAGKVNSSTESVNSGSRPDYQIYVQLGLARGEVNA
jgi:hypothetical protein